MQTKFLKLGSIFFIFYVPAFITFAGTLPPIMETALVETPLDTDKDGALDKIYIEVTRPNDGVELPTIYTISPYAQGGNSVDFHNVDVSVLPQDESQKNNNKNILSGVKKTVHEVQMAIKAGALERNYAFVFAHSLGTGNSQGCPTVGDDAEALAAKAVIDWLNGRAKAYAKDGKEVFASWANGAVGMSGVSYNGTLPNMVATTGVDGLKAIIPIAAISNWYDYYRANGLVVGPGGYVGEDADILGKFIVKSETCKTEMSDLTKHMGREHGDYTSFWQERDFIPKAKNVRAAVFVMHGQEDWNVRQKHAIKWWEALEDVVPKRMWLHNGGHERPMHANYDEQYWQWFDRFVKNQQNGVENQPAIEVQSPEGTWSPQAQWPHEETKASIFFLNANHALGVSPSEAKTEILIDRGRNLNLEEIANSPGLDSDARFSFLTVPLPVDRLMSGTAKIQLQVAVLNRRAANITVAIVDYDQNDTAKIVTRGWADPQNYENLEHGEKLIAGAKYTLNFELEPKQYTFPKEHRIGLIVFATDFDHTIRPDAGTKVQLSVGEKSFLELHLSAE